MKKRTYGQYCGLARALDVLGERWTLLLVRELLPGPKRYTDLLRSLDGIGTNLLAQRLKALEAAGLVVRRRLPPPASTEAYALTPYGHTLEPLLLDLATWGLSAMTEPPAADETFRPAWILLTLQARFLPEAANNILATCEYRVGDDVFHACIADAELTTHQGPAARPEIVIATDEATFRALAGGTISIDDARRQGLLTLDADEALWQRCRPFFDPATHPASLSDEMAVLDLTGRPSPRARRLR